MKTEPGERSLTPVSGVVLLLVGLGGAFFLERPFESLRPESVEAFQRLSGSLEDVGARLWEDPLQAVYQRRDETPAETPGRRLKSLAAQVQGAFEGRRWEPKLQLLGVMIPGGPYPEDVERRRRRRTALLASLALAGYVPRQSEWLGYFCAGGESASKLTIPYEWLEREGRRAETESGRPPVAQPPDWVLVLWLDEEGLGSRPVGRVGEVFLDVLGGSLGEGWERRVRPALLGPAGSGTLRVMLEEAGQTGSGAAGDPVGQLLRRLTIVSPWATADESLLLDEVKRREQTLEQALRAPSRIAGFSSTVVRDDELARELVRELERRGMELVPPDGEAPVDRVVLISEWDTFYGRALPTAFSRALESRVEELCGGACSDEEQADEEHERIWRYTYLRGLDGRGPHREGAGPSEVSSKSSEPPDGWPGRSSERKRLERAVGPAQLDGMRRLAEELERREQEGEGRVRAIGVLGSDLYDKQLVLQALRPRFPRAVFFTTDLDARLLHPASYPWSRNLVVASSYGLDPMRVPGTKRDTRFGWIAPFRDAYQVSTFVAARRALGLEAGGPLPRLFEVGRHGQVELALERPAVSLALVLGLFGFGAGGIVLLTLAPIRTGRVWLLTRPVFQSHPERLPQTAILVLAVLVFALLGWVSTHSWEPFLLGQGVSIWPTEMLRAMALVVCWLLLLRAHRELADNAHRLQEELGLPSDPGRPLPLKTRWQRWRIRWQGLRRARVGGHLSREPYRLGENLAFLTRVCRWVWLDRWTGGNGEQVPVARCWRRYRRLGDWRYRLERIVPMVFGYLLFGFLLASKLGTPFVPARGKEAFVADQAVLMASVISMIFLTFFVLDETLMCRALIRHLRSGPSRWPKKARADFARRYRLPEEAVATLIDIRFIAERTAVSGRLVIYPFIVFTLMMVARHGLFDGWDWPLGLLLILGVVVSLVAGCALILRREAEHARHGALRRLRRSLFQALGEDDAAIREVREKQVHLAIEEVAHLRRGAFGHWSQHPVLRAVLIPFGSLGMLSLLDLLSFLGL